MKNSSRKSYLAVCDCFFFTIVISEIVKGVVLVQPPDEQRDIFNWTISRYQLVY